MGQAKVLYLVRHAQAEPARPDQDDKARVLSREGREGTILAARGLKRLGVRFDIVLSSPLRRAKETALLLTTAIAAEVREHPSLAPGYATEDFVTSLAEYDWASAIVLVGHEPDMGCLASWLLLRDQKRLHMPFAPGQVAAIEVTAIPPRANGLLRWFATQQQLAFIGA